MIKENGAYTMSDKCLPCVSQPSDNCHTEVRLGEDSLGKDRIDNADKPRRFVKPTVEEIAAYCMERQNRINPQSFFDWNESKGWRVGNSPMKDWKAAIRTWEQRDKEKNPPKKEASNADRYAITEGFKTSF